MQRSSRKPPAASKRKTAANEGSNALNRPATAGGQQSDAETRSTLYTTGLFNSQRPSTAARQLNLDEVDVPNERGADESPPAHRRQSILGSAVQGIKRPLTALLKRPGSRSGSRERKAPEPSESIELPVGDFPQTQQKPSIQLTRKQGTWGDDITERPGTASGTRRRFSFGSARKGGSGSGSGSGNRPQTPTMAGYPKQIDLATLQKGDDGLTELETRPVTRAGNRSGAKSPDIPLLDELPSNELGGAVAQAPNFALHHVATYRELDTQLMRQNVLSKLDQEIDVSLLGRFLTPESDLKEEDVAWTWDYLFTQVSSYIRERLDSEKPEDEQRPQTAAPDR